VESTTVSWHASADDAVAIQSALRVARLNMLACGTKVGISPEILTRGMRTSGLRAGGIPWTVRHVAVVVVRHSINEVPGEVSDYLLLARDLQSAGRTVAVTLYVASDAYTQDHEDLAQKMPGDVGLRPWQLRRFASRLELAEFVAIDLVDRSVGDWLDQGGV
jgi:hypothetical protein